MKTKILSLFLIILMIVGSFGIINDENAKVEAKEACGCGIISNELVDHTGSDLELLDNHVLTIEEMAMRCGVIEGKEYDPTVGTAFTGDPPTSFDWRDYNDQDWVSPFKSQGYCGSCWAFATIGAIEAKANIVSNNPDLDLDLSEQFMVSCGTADTNNGDMPDYCMRGCDGAISDPFWWTQKNWFDWVVVNDAIDDDAFPYTSGSGNTGQCIVTDSEDILVDVTNWDWVQDSAHDYNDDENIYDYKNIKNALIAEGPLVACFKVYDDFGGHSGVYEYDGESSLTGGHAVLIIGYKDDNSATNGGYWICKNSWSSMKYFKIAYNYDYKNGILGFGDEEFEMGVAYIDISFDNLPKKSFHGTLYDTVSGEYRNWGNRVLRLSPDWLGWGDAYYKFDVSECYKIKNLDVGINYHDDGGLGDGPTVRIKNYETDSWERVWSSDLGTNSKFVWKWKNNFATSEDLAMEYVSSTGELFIKIHCDANDGTYLNTVGIRYDGVPPPEPELKVTGTLSWSNVETSSTQTGYLYVENDGETDSLLDWEVDFSYSDHPSCVTSISPSNGNDVDTDSSIELTIEVKAPSGKQSTSDGGIKFVNKDDSSEYVIKTVSISTPRNRLTINPMFINFLNQFPALRNFFFSFFQLG